MQQLQHFPLEQQAKQCPYPFALFVGHPDSNQHVAARTLASSLSHIPKWAVWCNSVSMEAFWTDALGTSMSIHSHKSHTDIATRLDHIVATTEHKVRYLEYHHQSFTTLYGSGIIIHVDGQFSDTLQETLGSIALLGIRLRIALIVLVPTMNNISPKLSSNLDSIIISGTLPELTNRILYEKWWDFKSLEDMKEFLSKTTNTSVGIVKRVVGKVPVKEHVHYSIVYDLNALTNDRDKHFFALKPLLKLSKPLSSNKFREVCRQFHT